MSEKLVKAGISSPAGTATAAADLLKEPPDAGLPVKGGLTERRISQPRAQRETGASMPIQTVLVVSGFGVLLVFGLGFAVRWMRKARLAPQGQRRLQLLDALAIGPKRFVYVVGFESRTLLIATGQEEVTLLAEYSEDDEAAGGGHAIEAPPPAPRTRLDLVEASAVEVRSSPPSGQSKSPAMRLPKRPVVESSKSLLTEAGLPAGAHRVPPAFRHLLKKTLNEEASA